MTYDNQMIPKLRLAAQGDNVEGLDIEAKASALMNIEGLDIEAKVRPSWNFLYTPAVSAPLNPRSIFI